MDLVIDANILFAALIKDGATAYLLSIPDIRTFIPEFIFEELLEHESEVLNKSKRTQEELHELLGLLRSTLIIVPREEFAHLLDEARGLSPDQDDAEYIALAMLLKVPIWSNDKCMKKQSKVEVLSTGELFVRLGFSKSV
ncbi:MAG: PIN domain-containing protein [Candidatus Micrarchaeota archaeon]